MTHILSDLRTAWKSLSSIEESSGWRGVGVADSLGHCLSGAVFFPEKMQAALFEFSDPTAPARLTLPTGNGFSVDMVGRDKGMVRVAISKLHTGSMDIFESMVVDLWECASTSKNGSTKLFMNRIRSWQDFMKSGNEQLSAEEEVGLIGELVTFNELLKTGLMEDIAVAEGWVGPLKADQDFRLFSGAIEVKTSASPHGFIANIASTDQLNPNAFSPLFFAAIKLSADASAQTLPELIESIKQRLGPGGPLAVFKNSLLRAGFLDIHSSRYTRKFLVKSINFFLVDDKFPHIKPNTLSPLITNISYELDVSRLPPSSITPSIMVRKLLENQEQK